MKIRKVVGIACLVILIIGFVVGLIILAGLKDALLGLCVVGIIFGLIWGIAWGIGP